MGVIIKSHATFEAKRRGISTKFIIFTVKNQQQKFHSQKGRVVVRNVY